MAMELQVIALRVQGHLSKHFGFVSRLNHFNIVI